MAQWRERPHLGSRFLVDLGTADARGVVAGFCQVVLPTPRLDEAGTSPTVDTLVLRRDFTGSLDLHAWSGRARRGTAPKRRTAKVELLDDAGEHVVATGQFRHARPVGLAHSPLQAMEPAVLIETVELAFDAIERS